MADPRDRAFGPLVDDRLDFTLEFQHTILTMLPAAMIVAASPFYVKFSYTEQVYVLLGATLYVKMFLSAALLGVDCASLALWCTSSTYRSKSSIAASVLACVAALAVLFIVYTKHRRALQSSTLISLYLSIGVVFDAIKIRSYNFHPNMEQLASLTVAAVVIKTLLVLFEEWPKRADIKDKDTRDSVGDESLSGFWGRSLFIWLNKTLLVGFRAFLTVDDLGNIGSEFASERLLAQSSALWDKADKVSKHWMARACGILLCVPFALTATARLCLSVFMFSQPLYLQRVVSFVGEDEPKFAEELSAILVGACAIIFVSVAISRALYNHSNRRLAVLLRGILTSQIFKKVLALHSTEAKQAAAMTLMSSDVEDVVDSLPQLHEIWASPIELGVGLYLLSTKVGPAAVLVAVPLLLSTVVSPVVGGLSTSAQTVWNETIQQRVAKTSDALSHIKSIKLMGLDVAVSKQIKGLRDVEIKAYKVVRGLWTVIIASRVFCNTITPTVVLAGGLFWTDFTDDFNPVEAFTTLTIVALIIEPLQSILQATSQIGAMLGCLNRLEAFFNLPEPEAFHNNQDSGNPSVRENLETEVNSEKRQGSNLTQSSAPSSQPAIRLSNLSVSPSEERAAILVDVNVTIAQENFAMLFGPTGSGKSTLLRSIIGSANATEGTITKSHRKVAYCGQTPWIENVSIRENIIGELEFDPVAYDAVINACLLQDDLLRLPDGDRTLAGSNGSRLSGGQKHRVALARAMYSRAEIVVLDDIFSALDERTANAVFTNLFGERGTLKRSHRTTILATNWVDHMQSADQALFIDRNGRVTSQLTPKKVLLSKQYVDEIASSRPTQPAAAAVETSEEDNDTGVRRHGDITLYRFFFSSIRMWLLAVWLLSVFVSATTERLPQIFIRIWLDTDSDNKSYFGPYAAIGASSCLVAIFTLTLYFQKIIPETAKHLHRMLLETVMNARVPYLESIEIGTIINRFSQDMKLLTQNLPQAFLMVVYDSSFVVLDVAVIASGAKYSAVIIPFIILVTYVVQFFYLRTSRQMRHLDIEAKAPLYTQLADLANGLDYIRSFGWENKRLKRCLRLLDRSQKPYYYMSAIQRWLELVLDLISAGLAVTIVAAAVYGEKTDTSQAALGLSLLTLISFTMVTNDAIQRWVTLETCIGALARLREFVKSTPTERPADAPAQPRPDNWPEEGGIVFDNVAASYDPRGIHQVLTNVSVRIPGGKKVGITGRTGSGKTSLLRALLNSLEYSGTITIDGVDISAIPRQELRSQVITTITQDAIKLMGTVRDNLVPYEGQKEDETMNESLLYEALDMLELWGHIQSQGGLDAPLESIGLSQGQLQLLCIARAMLHHTYTNSRIIVMDESTSNMDVDLDRNVQEILTDFFVDCTMLVVAHRTETLQDCNMYIDMADGWVVGTR